jgi:C-terminal processing protease CtpA/Prc
MRALAVALLLSVPLSADDKPSLEKAVELFRSPDASKRAAGSQLGERELRKLLGPLLKAMEDDDPEVRRRARRSILRLVPGEVERDEQAKRPPTHEAIRAAVAAALKAQKTQLHQARRRVHEEHKQRASRLVLAFGVRGTKWLPRKSGFFVQEVRKGSPAERLGLRRGDVIVYVNGKAVTESRDFAAALGDKPDWSRVTVTRLRDGQFVLLPNK